MFAFFQDFDIEEFNNLYSDVHNPISFTISSCNNTQTPSYDTTGKTQPCVKLWSQDKAKDFCQNINTAAVNAIEHILDDLVRGTRDFNQNNISDITSDICSIFSNAAKETFGVIYPHSKHVRRNKPWFNHECISAWKKFHSATQSYSKCKSVENKETLKSANKNHKNIMDKCIKNHKSELTKKLMNFLIILKIIGKSLMLEVKITQGL